MFLIVLSCHVIRPTTYPFQPGKPTDFKLKTKPDNHHIYFLDLIITKPYYSINLERDYITKSASICNTRTYAKLLARFEQHTNKCTHIRLLTVFS